MDLNIILNKIKEYETIVIHGHIRPDGDCYGAQFGLKDIIINSFPNKKVYVVGEISEYVSFIGTPEIIEDSVYEGALSIVVDTAVESRVSDQRFKLAKEVIKIDHHIPIDSYGDIEWVDTNFPSCAQMIAYFYTQFKEELKMSKTGATAMYTGIVTDTGRFRFRGVDELTHKMAGMLITKGASPDDIDFRLSQESLESVQLKGHVLLNLKTTVNGFVYFKMTRDIINKYGLSNEDAGALVSILGGIENHPVWALFIEGEDDSEIRVRLRSNGPTINDIANNFRGGGHARAAGATLESWNELESLIEAIDRRIIEWRIEQSKE